MGGGDVIDRATEWTAEHYPALEGAAFDAKVAEVAADLEAIDDAADELDRDDDAYERAVDQSISEWKDEGKVGMPRAVRRRR